MMFDIIAGKILRKARNEAGLTQEDMAEKLNYHTSVISKIENATMGIKTNLYVDWLKELNREDITVMTISGVPLETILEIAFTEEYKEKLKVVKNKPIDPNIIEKVNKLKKEFDIEF